MSPDGWDYAQELQDKLDGKIRKEIVLGPESIITPAQMTKDMLKVLNKIFKNDIRGN